MAPLGRMERRVRAASLMVLLGLVFETISLSIRHPLAILVLSMLGIGLVVLGILMFLLGLAFQEPARRD